MTRNCGNCGEHRPNCKCPTFREAKRPTPQISPSHCVKCGQLPRHCDCPQFGKRSARQPELFAPRFATDAPRDRSSGDIGPLFKARD